MSCRLETVVIKRYSIESPTEDIFVPECAAECTGATTRTEKQPLFFGKIGPLVERTVQVCPVSGDEFPTPLITDLMGLHKAQ